MSLFPEPLRAWAAAAQRLEDFLPDQNGLDIVDRMLLDRLMAERSSGNAWPNAATIFGWADCHPDGHYIGGGQMWERLMQLSGVSLTEPQSYGRRSSWLAEAQFEGQATRSGSRFTLTALGDQVVGGGVDVLPSCPFTRWVGGREVSRYRQLRR